MFDGEYVAEFNCTCREPITFQIVHLKTSHKWAIKVRHRWGEIGVLAVSTISYSSKELAGRYLEYINTQFSCIAAFDGCELTYKESVLFE